MTKILAYISEDVPDTAVVDLQDAAARLRKGPWTLGPPGIVDETDDSTATQPGDEPVRTIGLTLPVSGPNETPGTSRDEVKRFVDGVQFGSVYVGEIAAGRADRGVLEGLLMNW